MLGSWFAHSYLIHIHVYRPQTGSVGPEISQNWETFGSKSRELKHSLNTMRQKVFTSCDTCQRAQIAIQSAQNVAAGHFPLLLFENVETISSSTCLTVHINRGFDHATVYCSSLRLIDKLLLMRKERHRVLLSAAPLTSQRVLSPGF